MKTSWRNLSYRWKIIVPILIMGVFLAGMVYVFGVRMATNNVVETSIIRARTLSTQALALRHYYTENIVDTAKKNGLDITHDYTEQQKAIPLPATMTHELNSLFSEKADYEMRLYSNFPFPFRKGGGVHDEFQEKALQTLVKDPKSQFWKVEDYQGEKTLRFASADVMVAQTCVDCHNSHPQSPKTDWAIGDVRGILEVNLPLGKTLAAFFHDAKKGAIFVGVCMLVVIGIVTLMLDYLITIPLNEASAVGRRIAGGDLTTKIDVTRGDESGRILSTIGDMTAKLNTLISQVQGSSALVSTSSAVLSGEVKQLESVVAEQAASASEIAATSTEISKTSDQLVETMGELSSMSRDTAESANSSRAHLDHLESTLDKMAKSSAAISSGLYAINERAATITTIVKTITKVADQTNLISFNAGIESAKSGEQGRRFGVIAKEIRVLADQSAEASQDVKQMIEEMQTAVQEGVTSIEDFFEDIQRGIEDAHTVRTRLEEIIEKVQTLAPRFDTVSTGVETQSQGAGLINQSINELSDGAKEIANSLHQTNHSIEELTKVSQRLQEEISHFKVT